MIDGGKALAAGVKRVFGATAAVAPCTIHKTRNVTDDLPAELRPGLRRRLVKAFANPDAAAGLAAAKALAAELDKAGHQDAAASLREGLDDMFTVTRLGVTAALARSLSSTNIIESMIGTAKATMGNVKRWQDPAMIKRWTVAGMLNAERGFRRVKGCKEMAVLVAALKARVAAAEKKAQADALVA